MNRLLGVGDLADRVATDPRAQVAAGPPGPEQDRILALLEGHEDALLRTCRPGHLTGSALVVDPDDRRILLLFHAKLQRWLQPGGHADGDGDLARDHESEALRWVDSGDLGALGADPGLLRLADAALRRLDDLGDSVAGGGA